MSGIGNRTTNIQTLRRAIDAAERKALHPLGLTVAGFELLDILSRDPGITVPWAAARMNVSKQSTTTVLLRLAEAGLISRHPATPPDRSAALRLTTAGRTTLEAARAAVSRVDAAFTAGYRREELRELDRLLGVAVSAFPNERLTRVRAGTAVTQPAAA
ncbi:MAG: MarR family transcriptional regulator [Catenulispora sp.]|nr:MarR family transcriptional regulator [Catenulispora sp.]